MIDISSQIESESATLKLTYVQLIYTFTNYLLTNLLYLNGRWGYGAHSGSKACCLERANFSKISDFCQKSENFEKNLRC